MLSALSYHIIYNLHKSRVYSILCTTPSIIPLFETPGPRAWAYPSRGIGVPASAPVVPGPSEGDVSQAAGGGGVVPTAETAAGCREQEAQHDGRGGNKTSRSADQVGKNGFLWSSDALWHQWAGPSLVQVMAFHLFNAKPLPESMLMTPRNKLEWNLHQSTKLFFKETAYEEVSCEMAAISSGFNMLTHCSLVTWSNGIKYIC